MALYSRTGGFAPKKYKGLYSSSGEFQNEVEPEEETGLKGVATGVAKEGLSTIFKSGKFATGLARTLLPKFAEPKEGFYDTEQPVVAGKTIDLETRGTAEKIGGFTEQVAEFVYPATKVAKINAGASFLRKLITRAITSGGVATAQSGEFGKETGIAAGVEVALPVAGKVVLKPVANVVSRLFKGLGSGLSGVSTDVIDTIVKYPRKALEVSKQLIEKGNFSILEDNAKAIVNGVSKIRQEARKAYGKAVQVLKSEDINPTTFRGFVQEFLDKVGSTVKGQFRELKNVEFDNPRNIKKASNLIDDLSNVKLDGFSLNKMLQKIRNARFKTTGQDPERLAFNAFITDMENSVKNALSKSTNKLDEINKAFSTDMQLVEGIERIFSKIKFKSLAEVEKVALKLEQLFGQKGLNPRDIDRFLSRIGIDPGEFRTTEAVRQISGKITGANTKGLTITELAQQVTSAVITPETVKNISIATGLSKPIIESLFKKIEPTFRGALIELLTD